MIDCHCHLSYKDFDRDRYEVAKEAKKVMSAIIDSAPSPEDARKSLDLTEKYPNFIYSTLGLHPTIVLELKGREIENYIEFIRENREKIVGIGEVGIDYFDIRETKDIQKTKEVFIQFIELAKELNLPLIIHARDAFRDAVKILSDNDAKKVILHCFGALDLIKEVEENKWFVTLPPLIERSKKHRKISKRLPIELILTETDSPWFGLEKGQRGVPQNVRVVIERIAKERKLSFEEVDRITTQNAIKFFNL